MGRPLEFNKDEALEKAMHVFWRKGYEATSLQDLIDAMGLSKSSFYQSFTSKKDLFEKCLGNYQNKLVSDLSDGLVKSKHARKFIEKCFRDVTSTNGKDEGKCGCFLINSSNEFHFREDSLSPLISNGFQKIGAVFQIAVKQAQHEGDISPAKNADSLASFIISSLSGLRTMIKAGTDSKTLNGVVENIFETIFQKK